MSVKLNLGAGDPSLHLPDHVNIDVKAGGSIYPVVYPNPTTETYYSTSHDTVYVNPAAQPFRPGSVDEIRASHVLEHLGHREAREAIQLWASLLKPGGVLKIAVPDFKWIAEKYLAGEQHPIAAYAMGGQSDEHDFHKTIFDEEDLTRCMEVGLTDISRWQSEIQDCASLPVSLNLQGRKPVPAAPKSVPKIPRTVAVMSLPRVTWTCNMFSALEVAVARRLPFEKVEGVFWSQCLTRVIEPHVDNATADWIFCTDYDSVYGVREFDALCQLMLDHPEADAIAPLQCKRDDDYLLMGLLDNDGKPYPPGTKVTLNHFQPELIRASWAHFGATLIRVDAIRRMKRPWFLESPNSNGRWGEGRTDPDIYFWRNFVESGNTLFLAPHVHLAHAQVMYTLPGPDLKPKHVYPNQFNQARKA